jgi:hypothetical protein
MSYIKLENGTPTPYSFAQLRKDNPNISFPREVSDEWLAGYGVYPYTRPAPSEYNDLAWRLIDDDFVEVNGAWVLPYTLEALPLEQAERNVRFRRNDLLTDTDWTQVADAPVDQAAWATYRQALRDITTQAGFPTDITWPTKPE